jgi:hypothetical protein
MDRRYLLGAVGGVANAAKLFDQFRDLAEACNVSTWILTNWVSTLSPLLSGAGMSTGL